MRVVIAEDLTLLRDGLVRMLSAYGFDVVRAVGDGSGLAELLVSTHPDVAVLDVRLPPSHTDEGLRAALAARRRLPGLPVLILSQYVERLYARELLTDRRGAVGYLLKDRVGEVREFIDAIHRVAAGGTVMDPEVVMQMLSRHDRVATLTTREREVLGLMAEGRSNAAIAGRLVVTEKAISKHINSIFTKLDLPASPDGHRRVLAVVRYLQAG